MMVNLVLDTNAWIYLANGFNPETLKNEEDGHFQLSEKIITMLKDGKCRIFSNYIIKKEWARNKDKCEYLIRKYNNDITQLENILRKKRKREDYIEHANNFNLEKYKLKLKIERNRLHINNIEEIISQSIEISITDQQKLDVIEWAVDKKPPFHHKDNSVGDALIFLSTVDYFFYDFDEYYIDNTIFISNNTSDFSEMAGSSNLHPVLQKMLEGKPIIFERNLPKALEVSDEIIVKYDSYLDYLNRDVISCLMSCKGTEYFMAEVLFDKKTVIETNQDALEYNPNQYRLDFGDDFNFTEQELLEINSSRHKYIDVGSCNFCYALHIRCECGEEHASYGDDIECGCGRAFTLSENEVELISSHDEF